MHIVTSREQIEKAGPPRQRLRDELPRPVREDHTSYELNHSASGLLTSILVNMMKILGPYKVGNSLTS